MHIAIVGCGFVGNTYKNVLSERHEIYVVDPGINSNKITDHSTYDGIILCLPTPSNDDGSCDYSAVIDVIEQIEDTSIPVLIKSTINIECWQYIEENFSNPFTFSPEFLRQDHATTDIRQNKRVILAGKKTQFWWTVLYVCRDFTYKEYCHTTDVEEVILTKYAINAFLATKVAWFNQLYDFCEERGLDYEKVKKHVTSDERIGPSHTKVTEERGFGGACFPKDTLALMEMANHTDTLSILDCAIGYNDTIRSS